MPSLSCQAGRGFGSYQAGPETALANAVRHLKEGGAQAVKLEGGRRVLPQVTTLAGAGIPVMGHLGLTPQSVNMLGGTRRVQGRGDAGDQLLADALALERAGAFAVVLESVPASLGRRVSGQLRIPTIGIGIGAGPDCDAQVMVWQDMAGLTCKGLCSIAAQITAALRASATEVPTTLGNQRQSWRRGRINRSEGPQYRTWSRTELRDRADVRMSPQRLWPSRRTSTRQMRAFPAPAIMNNHATWLGLAGRRRIGLKRSCAQIAADMGGLGGRWPGCKKCARIVDLARARVCHSAAPAA
jgi:hypothetical protein